MMKYAFNFLFLCVTNAYPPSILSLKHFRGPARLNCNPLEIYLALNPISLITLLEKSYEKKKKIFFFF